MKKCEKCGAEMKDNANFCTSCGEVLQEAANEPNEQAKVEETKINQTENSMNMQDKMEKEKESDFCRYRSSCTHCRYYHVCFNDEKDDQVK